MTCSSSPLAVRTRQHVRMPDGTFIVYLVEEVAASGEAAQIAGFMTEVEALRARLLNEGRPTYINAVSIYARWEDYERDR